MFWIIVDYVIRKSEEIKFWWTQMPQDNKLGSDLPREIPPPLSTLSPPIYICMKGFLLHDLCDEGWRVNQNNAFIRATS